MAKKVLTVDDDADIRTFVVTVLEENGYTPIEATNGEEGMALLRKDPPDLVVLDVLMPRESGVRLYRQMKTNAKYKKIPVIILSGITKKSFIRSQKALTEFGGEPVPEPEAYLEKPVEPEELAAAIKAVLN